MSPDFAEISSDSYEDIALTWYSAVTLTFDLLAQKPNLYDS